jgi:hypothetical protein
VSRLTVTRTSSRKEIPIALNDGRRVIEIVTPGTPEALNAALAERGIGVEQVIHVQFQPAKPMALGDWEAKYRVLVIAD